MAVPAPHNLSVINASGGIPQFAKTVSSALLNDMFGIMLLVTIYLILFISLMTRTDHWGKANCAAAFVCFICAIFLRGLDWIPDLVLYSSLGLAALSVAFLTGTD